MGLKPPPRNRLLVEGLSEQRVIPELIEGAGIPWGEKADPIVMISPYEGVDDLLAPSEIVTQSKSSGLAALGVIVDADLDPVARWAQLRARVKGRFDLPEQPPASGLVVANRDGLRFGAWLMPDNISRGMLETFLCMLRPTDKPGLLEHSERAAAEAKRLGAPFKDTHADKAHIHSWLAWQDPPGLQLHQAVLTKVLDPTCQEAASFVRWFKELFCL
jgi:hypothetical protein